MARARGECFQSTSEVADDGRTLSFKLVSLSGTLLRRQNDYAVGYHLFSTKSIVIEGGATLVVDTGVVVSMSRGCYVQIFHRSMSPLSTVSVSGDVIDRTFTRTIRVVVYNFSSVQRIIRVGDLITQMIVQQCFVQRRRFCRNRRDVTFWIEYLS